jgi:hypothetical protein
VIEVVYKGRDNPNTISVKQDGVLIPWSAVTRMVLSFVGSEVVADTDNESTLIDWSIGDGIIEFNINGLAVTARHEIPATLVVYDPQHPNGQVLTHATDEKLFFKFVS